MPLVLVLLALLVPASARSAPAVSCHCLRDREYDPRKSAAADPYVLATARNSLLAAALGIDKGEVVRALMMGTSPEDLWISHWVAWRTGLDASALLSSRLERGSWQRALAGLEKARFGTAFVKTLDSGGSESSLAGEAVDDVLVSRLRVDPPALRRLRDSGVSSQEAILSCLLSARLGRPPADVLAEVRGGRKTWGALLHDVGLAPKEVEAEIRRSLH